MQKRQNKLKGNILKNNIYIILIFLVAACGGPKSLNQINLANEYVNSNIDLTFQTHLINENDSISILAVEFNTDQLLFSKNNEEEYIARYSISYKVYTNYNDNQIIDSSQIHYSINQDLKTPKKTKHNIKIFAPKGSNYIIQTLLTDENKAFSKSNYSPLVKLNNNGDHYFKIESSNKEHKGHYQKDSFNISYQKDTTKYLKVLTFKRQHYIAPKPHDLSYSFRFLGDPDSSWLVSIPQGENLTFPPLQKGFYHFITDTISKKGFSVYHINQQFPSINNLPDAIGAMGYLLPQKEYANLLMSKTPRSSFEYEWKKIGGGKERARNLIREYYKSVSNANSLFTSYKPGWSTDRGMIYIVYGPPKVVYRYDEAEVWIYGEENNLLSEVFKFDKIDSSISSNIYILERNINYKVNWNRMVTSWKEDKGF